MASTFSELDDLVALITTAVADVKAEYTKLNLPFPKLADVNPHPIDSTIIPQKLQRATQTISGACAQLSALVVPPSQIMYMRAGDFITTASLRVALESNIADILKDHPDGLHVSEVASRSGIEQGKIGRVLRLLATKHCFREVKKDVWANNRLSVGLLQDNPLRYIIAFNADDSGKAGGYLYETLEDKVSGPSYAVEHTPFARFHGKPVWDFFLDNPDRSQRFSKGMPGFAQVFDTNTMIHGYPWQDIPAGSTLCDVGGGFGHISMNIARLNPGLRVVLQDLPSNVEPAKALWQAQASDIIQAGKIEFVPIDFFKDIPVAGCDYYYMKHVIHNWPDNASKTILANVKKAMQPNSRLILQEYVIQHTSRDQDNAQNDLETAPEPLLPNFGEGRFLRYRLDLSMMIVFGSHERTLDNFKELGNAVGLELVEVRNCGELSAIEYRLAEP
ncbi:hypothetical protein EIP91_002036 [Steccherinum ochraceum]|uniref:Uncharacterized protein n=1 Tax=Steccherinum ochraceum TaxID=92696 RepID=A0A4V6N758_9APHY|nr:hypothetical protein EIP91_002036 [Steccherinum ochraceum]